MIKKIVLLPIILGITVISSDAQSWMTPNNISFSLGNTLTYQPSISDVSSVRATTAQVGIEWSYPIAERYNLSLRINPGVQTPNYKSMRFFMDFSFMGYYSVAPKFEIGVGVSAWKRFYKKPNEVGESQYYEWELETKNNTQIGSTVAIRYQLTKRLSTAFSATYFPRIYALDVENQVEKHVLFKSISSQISVHYKFSR